MNENAPSSVVRRLFLIKALTPVVGFSLGVDGGEVFQIIAVDTLLIGPGAIGTALGLGTLSVPLQVWAARIPLHRARHNIRLFIWSMGVMALVAAMVVWLAEPGSLVAQIVLPMTILAELSVSILYATSMQPLIGYTMSSAQRQNVLSRTGAMSSVAVFLLVLVVGQVGSSVQAALLAAMGLTSLALGWSLRVLPAPPDDVEESAQSGGPSRSLLLIYLLFVGSGLAGLPLVLTYVALVMWPTGNLGVVGAALAAGSIIAPLLWRDVGSQLNTVLVGAALAAAASVVAFVLLPNPVGSDGWPVALLMVAVLAVASVSVFRIASMEFVHRQVDTSSLVRVMTLLDVVGSTTSQLGLFAAGMLIEASWSGRFDIGPEQLDPYRLWLLLASAVMVVCTLTLVGSDRSNSARHHAHSSS